MTITRRSRYAPFALAVAIAAVAVSLGGGTASSAVAPIAQGRIADPVVVRGAAVPSLANVPVGDIVAFRWSTQWVRRQMDSPLTLTVSRFTG